MVWNMVKLVYLCKKIKIAIMRRLLLSLLLISCGFVAGLCQAPGEAPVKWQVTVKMNGAEKGTVVFKARVQSGWHLYGMNLPKGGPKSTEIDMSESTGVEFTTPLKPDRAPLKVHDDMFGLDLTWWDSDIAFRRDFKVKNKANARIAGKISYMSCNNETCSPPKTQSFDKIIK